MKDYLKQYNAGFWDGFRELPPMWLGIEWYKNGYEAGAMASQEPAYPLIGQSHDGLQRVYLVDSTEVFLEFTNSCRRWRGMVPGWGGVYAFSIESAINNIRYKFDNHGRWYSEKSNRAWMFGDRVILIQEKKVA